MTKQKLDNTVNSLNSDPAEPGYTLSLQTVQIPNLHCVLFSKWICINNLDQVIWLADN